MSTPILYIGLGTSGLRMLEEAQRFFYSCTPRGDCRPAHTRFLFVETDPDQMPVRSPCAPEHGPAIERLHFPSWSTGVSVRQLEKMATTRVNPDGKTEHPDAKPILRIEDGKLIESPLEALNLPSVLLASYPHVFALAPNGLPRLSNLFLDGVRDTIQQLRLNQGSVAIRLTGDPETLRYSRPILEVYVPDVPEKLLRRIEVLFNGVELIYQDGAVRWLPCWSHLACDRDQHVGGRSFARMALWADSATGQGICLRVLRHKVERLHRELLAECGPNRPPLICIAGSFAGATCGGMFIDVAYLCQDIVDPTHKTYPSLMGLFLLPPESSDSETRVSNAYACLRDLEHFSSRDAQFLAKWPFDMSIRSFLQGRRPFYATTLLSLSWVGNGQLPSLHRAAGLYLFLLGTNLGDHRVNQMVNEYSWKFSALGMTALFYPRGEIRQCAASKLAREFLIQGWLLPHESRGLATIRSLGREAVPLDVALQLAKRRILRAIDDVLNRTVETMLANESKSRPAMCSVDDFWEGVRQGHDEFSARDLIPLLGESGPIYTWWKSQLKLTMDELHKHFGDLLVSEIEFYENLPLARRIVSFVAEEIDSTLRFWGRMGLENWNRALIEGHPTAGHPALLEQLLENRGHSLGQSKRVRLERFHAVLRKMCLSLLREPLEKLANYLRDGNTDRFTPREAVPDPAQVPNEEAIRQAQTLLESTRLSLVAFEDAVGAGVKPNDMIHYHLRTGRFQGAAGENGVVLERGDVDEAAAAFEQRHSRRMATDDTAFSHSSVLLGYGIGKLWGFLAKSGFLVAEEKADAAGTLAGELIRRLSQALELERLPDSGDASAFTRHPELPSLASFAMRKMSINPVVGGRLMNSPYLPKLVVTGKPAQSELIKDRLEVAGLHRYYETNPSACDPLFEDMVLFYDERPLEMLSDLAIFDFWEPVYQRRKAHDASVDCYILT